MKIKLSVTGKMNIEQIEQQQWRGDSPDIMLTSTFAGQEMRAIQKSDEEPHLFELHYLGYSCVNIKGMALAKSQAPEFAQLVLSKLQDLIKVENSNLGT